MNPVFAVGNYRPPEMWSVGPLPSWKEDLYVLCTKICCTSRCTTLARFCFGLLGWDQGFTLRPLRLTLLVPLPLVSAASCSVVKLLDRGRGHPLGAPHQGSSLIAGSSSSQTISSLRDPRRSGGWRLGCDNSRMPVFRMSKYPAVGVHASKHLHKCSRACSLNFSCTSFQELSASLNQNMI